MAAVTPLTCAKILLAEDDPDQSEMLKATLEDEGCTVDTAFNGAEALKMLLSNTYDLAILDYRMPEMNGGVVLRKFHAQSKSDVPIVVVSAFATATDMQRYRADGAAATCSKPYDISELIELLAELRAKKHSPSAAI